MKYHKFCFHLCYPILEAKETVQGIIMMCVISKHWILIVLIFRWIAWGIVFCGLSCYILALPHFIYGAGEDALQLTKEYMKDNSTISLTNFTQPMDKAQRLCSNTKYVQECEALLTVVPLILIFLSQFVLGIGNTLYYSLGQVKNEI